MTGIDSIITVGISPCWDVTCWADRLAWGEHRPVQQQTVEPAGKALNVSRALAWLGQSSTAAGLWGKIDHQQMRRALGSLSSLIKPSFTLAAGQTRHNVTIIDQGRGRQMHLRAPNELASSRALGQLRRDLQRVVRRDSVCVFSGSMPNDQLLGDVLGIIRACRDKGGRLVIDTSGAALRDIVELGDIDILKPNVAELAELLGRPIPDTPAALARAGSGLLDRAQTVLISRGSLGAIVVTKRGAWQGKCIGKSGQECNTVGCGDFLLAGFLYGQGQGQTAAAALATGIQVATARAWGQVDTCTWQQACRTTKVSVRLIAKSQK